MCVRHRHYKPRLHARYLPVNVMLRYAPQAETPQLMRRTSYHTVPLTGKGASLRVKCVRMSLRYRRHVQSMYSREHDSPTIAIRSDDSCRHSDQIYNCMSKFTGITTLPCTPGQEQGLVAGGALSCNTTCCFPCIRSTIRKKAHHRCRRPCCLRTTVSEASQQYLHCRFGILHCISITVSSLLVLSSFQQQSPTQIFLRDQIRPTMHFAVAAVAVVAVLEAAFAETRHMPPCLVFTYTVCDYEIKQLILSIGRLFEECDEPM